LLVEYCIARESKTRKNNFFVQYQEKQVDIKQGEKASTRADDLCLAATKMLKKAKAFTAV